MIHNSTNLNNTYTSYTSYTPNLLADLVSTANNMVY